MNIHHLVYKGIWAISIISIFTTLTIGFILPISLIQALLINPIILVISMFTFAISSKKLIKSKPLASIVHLANNSKCKPCTVSKAA